MTLSTPDVENIAEKILNITNPIIARTSLISNLNCHMIDNVRLSEIDEHM